MTKSLSYHIVTENNSLAKKIEALFRRNQYCQHDQEHFYGILKHAILNPSTATLKHVHMQQKLLSLLFCEYVERTTDDIKLKDSITNILSPGNNHYLLSDSELIIRETNKLAKAINMLFKTNTYCKHDQDDFDFILSKAILNPKTAKLQEVPMQQKMISLLIAEYVKRTTADPKLINEVIGIFK